MYYNARELAQTVEVDAGAHIRDVIKGVATDGVCPEDEWPYDASKFAQKPPNKCYTDALKYRTIEYQRLSRILNQMKGCLASGDPFIFGFTVYENFETDVTTTTGHLSMPTSHSQQPDVLGGHCVIAVGYDDLQNHFIAYQQDQYHYREG